MHLFSLFFIRQLCRSVTNDIIVTSIAAFRIKEHAPPKMFDLRRHAPVALQILQEAFVGVSEDGACAELPHHDVSSSIVARLDAPLNHGLLMDFCSLLKELLCSIVSVFHHDELKKSAQKMQGVVDKRGARRKVGGS